jgi:hypothetical protein
MSATVECGQDRTWTAAFLRAGCRQSRERFAGVVELGDLLIQSGDPRLRQLPRPGPIVGRAKVEQLPDLGKREARRLRGTNELQPPDVVIAVAPDLARGPCRFRQETAPLIVAHRLHAHARRFRKRSDRVRTFRLIPYHGTGAIRVAPTLGQEESDR